VAVSVMVPVASGPAVTPAPWLVVVVPPPVQLTYTTKPGSALAVELPVSDVPKARPDSRPTTGPPTVASTWPIAIWTPAGRPRVFPEPMVTSMASMFTRARPLVFCTFCAFSVTVPTPATVSLG
jgi:hypothetical protein